LRPEHNARDDLAYHARLADSLSQRTKTPARDDDDGKLK